MRAKGDAGSGRSQAHRGRGLALLLVLACAACAGTPPLQLAPRMTVVNRTSAPIATILYRPCNAGSATWQTLAIEPLPPGQSLVTEFPASCADYTAQFGNGRTAGSQSGVKQQFPFRWDIY